MNLSIPKIVSGSTIALGTLVAGAYFGINELLKPSTLRKKLVLKGFKPIKSDDIAQWDLEFESDQEKIKEAFGSGVTDGTKLKEECEKRLNSDSEKDVENVKKWCGIRSISSEIARRKKTLLTNAAGSGSGLDWNNTYGRRKSSNSDTSHFGLDANKIRDNNNDDEGLKVVQGWCKGVENSDYLASTKNIVKLTEDWCTKEGLNQ